LEVVARLRHDPPAMNTAHATPTHSSHPNPGPQQIEHPSLLKKDGSPISVLLVEDDIQVAGLLLEYIEDRGGRVIGTAAEPAEAFGLVVEQKPDVVVMDVRLKDGHDGLHAAEAMRLLHQTPIVFCTGYADVQTVERIRQFGGAPCLFKPVTPTELANAILQGCGLL
jgi:two-component system, response regulator PdtaR